MITQRVGLIGNTNFCEPYEHSSSNYSPAGIPNDYYASGTILNARNAIGSKTVLLFCDCVNFLAVLTLRKSLCKLQNGLKWSENLQGNTMKDLFPSKNENRLIGLDGISRNKPRYFQ